MLSRATAALLAVHLALLPAHVMASQNQLSSPTTGTVSGLQLTNNYNNALDSVNTMNAGASAPTNQLSGTPSPGNWWLNTTSIPYPAQVYDGASWLTPFWIDATNHVTNVKIGGGTAVVASASTVDLCASTGDIAPRAYITVTGTTTITSFGSTCQAGHVKFVTFAGALTLAYNATSLILPGGQNVMTVAGDQAMLVALGSGNWQVAFYQPASGAALVNPAIDVGAIEWTFSPNVPSAKYMWAYGQTVSRTTYGTLLNALTIAQTVTITSGSPTLTGFSDTTQIGPGACVEGPGIPNAGSCTAQIQSCTATTCTMNVNGSASSSNTVTIYPYRNGNGVTTFNLPDCRGLVLAGRDNMGGTAAGRLTSAYFNASQNPDALGQQGGSQSQTLTQAMLPSVTFNGSVSIPAGQGSHLHGPSGTNSGFLAAATPGGVWNVSPGSGASNVGSTGSATLPAMSGTASVSSGGGDTPFPNVQPTLTANCLVRVLSKLEVPRSRLVASDDALGIEGRRSVAS